MPATVTGLMLRGVFALCVSGGKDHEEAGDEAGDDGGPEKYTA